MKVLMLCWRDSTHPQGGGSERYLERVAEYLAARGHQVIYRSAKHSGAPRKQQHNAVTTSAQAASLASICAHS